jgi:hypothetical protein
LFLFFLLCFSLINLVVYTAQLRVAVSTIGQLMPREDAAIAALLTATPLISVIVPAYNEANNIQACVTSILNSTTLSSQYLEVWVVDDQSTDETWAILTSLQQQLQDP